MAQLVGCDVERLAVGSGQSRGAHCFGQSAFDPGAPRAPAVLEEQEIHHAAVPLVRQPTLGSPLGPPLGEDAQGGFVQWDAAFAVQLAQRYPKPVPGRSVVHDAVELEVEQLAHTKSGSTQHNQGDAGEQIG